MAEQKFFKVTDGPLSIRKTPDGERIAQKLITGDEIAVPADSRTEAGGYVWWQHGAGWSASNSTKGEVYMVELEDVDPASPLYFKVTDGPLSVRATPNGDKLASELKDGDTIEVQRASRTEAGNYIWWQHALGWSAERSASGSASFMTLVSDVDPAALAQAAAKAAAAAKPKRVEIPAHLTGKQFMQVAANVKVRDQPSTNPRGLIIKWIARGEALECDFDTLTEADGYFWVKHDLGWSAIQSVDGETVFLAEPGTIPGLVYIGPEGPVLAELPGYQSLVERLPVALKDIQWFQYFGNNMWAYVHGKSYGYDAYSQGLHGGLDFGNSARAGVPIYAGITGTVSKVDTARAHNWQIWVETGDYVFIYQHIYQIQNIAVGQKVTPDTKLATIQHNSQQGGWDHLHFEVRYLKNWIINPLVLMPEAMVAEIVGKFDPKKPNTDYTKLPSTYNFFWGTDEWTKWTTPLDQPALKLAGPVIGPRAAT